MKRKRTLHPMLQRIAALAILGIAMGSAISVIALPLAEAFASHRTVTLRLARLESRLQAPEPVGVFYDPDDLTTTHADAAEAQVALQSALNRIAGRAGVSIQSVQPLAAEYLGAMGQGVWIEVSFSCDLQSLVDFLKEMDIERPVMLVRRIQVDRSNDTRPDTFLRVKLEAGRARRTGETK
jgi:hypothetical protein